MPNIKIDINKITEEQVQAIADYLKCGLVIAYPTDTIYGLGCDAHNAQAVVKIEEIKERGTRKPSYAKAPEDKQENKKTSPPEADPPSAEKQKSKAMIALMSDFEMLKRYCVVSEEQIEYLKKIWPGPVTVILESRKNLPDELTGGLKSLAVRLPASEFLVKIISKCGFPVVSTSLNKTGQPPLNNVKNLKKYFAELPDLVIDAGECKKAKPSRLVDLRDTKNIIVLRE